MNHHFSGQFDALLFDMDGTILNSISAVNRSWTAWAKRAGIPPEHVLSFMHGRRAIDTIRKFAAPPMVVEVESKWLDDLELEDVAGITPLAGAQALLSSLLPSQWAVVTSAGRELAKRRITAAGLPAPHCLVTADDVVNGKPDPEGYVKAAAALGVKPARCLVFEDTIAGATAGLAAGASVTLLSATIPQGLPPVSAIIEDYTALTVRQAAGALSISVGNEAR